MEANGTNENLNKNIDECIIVLEEALKETINIVQLFGDVAESGDEAVYIQRSIHTIEKMLKAICDTDLERLKKALIE